MTDRSEVTNIFKGMFDAFRSEVQGMPEPLKVYDRDSEQIGEPITSGWLYLETQTEDLGRTLELHITDRPGIDFDKAVIFNFDGRDYERQGFGNPAPNNVREWVWTIRPIGTSEGDDE